MDEEKKEKIKTKIKEGVDKVVKSSKDALGKAGTAVQDFSDKSVIRIEKRQLESKRNAQVLELGELAFKNLTSNPPVALSESDEEVKSIIEEIKRLDKEIKNRKESLASESKKDEPSETEKDSDSAGE